MTAIAIPEFALVVLIGASGAGKSTFARRHFRATEIVSSDACRLMVADDETDLAATPDAFALLHFIAEKRLAARRLTVIDATSVRAEDRRGLVALAKRHHALPVAVALDPGEAVCRARNRDRPERDFGRHVIARQSALLRRSLPGLRREGFRHVFVLDSEAAIDAAQVARVKLWTDRRDDHGPFDIVGDIHGCADELAALLGRLGYAASVAGEGDARRWQVTPPPGRRAVFLGDLVDRGPRIADTLRLVMDMVADGHALCVLGNHDAKALRWLDGKQVKPTHGLDRTIAELEEAGPAFRARVRAFIDGLRSHYWLAGGTLAVAHAGIRQEMLGRASGAIREFCLYGATTGETDGYGLPIRLNWAAEHRGETCVVHGHTPVARAEWLNNTICLDTGCVFGGRLTALRWPERELVDVPAARVHWEPTRPLATPAALSLQQLSDATLDSGDVLGKRQVATRMMGNVTVRAENAAAAFEVLARFSVDPRWLAYLPPTMPPPDAAERPGLLEHPDQAFAGYRRAGLAQVMCEEKHMGSRAVLVLCRDEAAALRRFGVESGAAGAIHTRTGRPFFADAATRDAVLARVRAAVGRAGLWKALATDWLVLDAEIMPWSAKAQALIEAQYAPAEAAARSGLGAALGAAREAVARGVAVQELADALAGRLARAKAFGAAWRRYVWPVASVDDLRVAPFHVLAGEGAVHLEQPHDWHLAQLAPLAAHDPLLTGTRHRAVDLADAGAVAAATAWWEELAAAGGEGMVVKPLGTVARGRRGLVQPAVKCRGPEYLRLIYGPDYDAPQHLARLRERTLATKRGLALREFALGHEGLHRFVAGEPLRRVHECVAAVLALESEPVDPRL